MHKTGLALVLAYRLSNFHSLFTQFEGKKKVFDEINM